MNTLQFLKNNRNILVLAHIESDVTIAGEPMPQTTLNRYLASGYIPVKWKEPLRQYLEKIFNTTLDFNEPHFVYEILNEHTKRTYIGCTLCANYDRRIAEHFARLKKGNHHAWELQRDFRMGHALSVRIINSAETKAEAMKIESDSIAADSYNHNRQTHLLKRDSVV